MKYFIPIILIAIIILTWNSVLADIIGDSYSESNYSVDGNLDGEPIAFGQSFTAVAGDLTRADFYLKKVNSPSANMVAKLYAHSGTFGVDSIPTGAALATSNAINAGTLTTSYALVQFTFATPYTMVAGMNYVIVLECTASDPDNVLIGADNTSPSHAGIISQEASDLSWTSGTADLIFYVYESTQTTPSASVQLGEGTVLLPTGSNGSIIFN